MEFKFNTFSASILALALLLTFWSASATTEDSKDYAHDSFDAASFYDRKAPNEKSEDYIEEKKRDFARQGSASSSLVHATREEQILILEDDLRRLRDGELAMALQRVSGAESALRVAKSNLGWFASKEDKERIVLLEKTTDRHRRALATVHNDERALELKLKPLYGIVSRQFWDDQRRAISSSIDTVHKMAAEQSWWSTMFSIGQTDSLQELIMHAVTQYFVVSLICYFFGTLFFALWTSPWMVYEYSSSIIDLIFVGVPSYLLAVMLMLVPVLCIFGIFWGISHVMENRRGAAQPRAPGGAAVPDVDAAAREEQRRRAQRAQHAATQRQRFAPAASATASSPEGMRYRGGFGGGLAEEVD